MSKFVFPVIFTVIGMILLGIFLTKRIKGATPAVAILKSWISVGFMGVAVSSVIGRSLSGRELVFALLVICGLFFGLLGDIWLDLKYAHREYDKPYTYAGIVSFIMGHIMYCSALIFYFQKDCGKDAILIPLAVCVVITILMVFSEKPMKVNYGDYKPIIIIYSFFITAFPAFAVGYARLFAFKNVPLDILLVASLVFAVSDAILNGTYFGKGKDRPVDIITNHVTYYWAQYAVAFTLMFIGSAA